LLPEEGNYHPWDKTQTVLATGALSILF
jgi:hypothetical protein